MRKRKGFSLIEAVTGASFMMLVTLGAASMLIAGTRSFARTSSDVTLAQKNAQGLRRVSEMIREAMTATITDSGTVISYTLPRRANSADAYTGEVEYVFPPVSDGVARGYRVDFAAGTLTNTVTGRVLVRNIAARDPDPQSSTYGQTYQPFVFSSVGSRRVVLINLITRERVNGQLRYQRMKNTVLLRNTPW